MIEGYEKDTRISDKVTNTQPDTITYSKTLTDIQEDQSNKGATKKSMIQQTLLQSYAYIKKRSRSLGESTSERDLVNDARDTDISKQNIHNSQKTNVDAPWIEVSGKKRNRNSPEMSTPRKQSKINRYQSSKPVPTINSFERLEEESDDENNNIRMKKTAKTLPIFVARINNFSSLSQHLKEVTPDEYEIKIMNEQIKPRRSIAYVSIVKELKNRKTEFHT